MKRRGQDSAALTAEKNGCHGTLKGGRRWLTACWLSKKGRNRIEAHTQRGRKKRGREIRLIEGARQSEKKTKGQQTGAKESEGSALQRHSASMYNQEQPIWAGGMQGNPQTERKPRKAGALRTIEAKNRDSSTQKKKRQGLSSTRGTNK